MIAALEAEIEARTAIAEMSRILEGKSSTFFLEHPGDSAGSCEKSGLSAVKIQEDAPSHVQDRIVSTSVAG
jgi:hypothetical protein